MFVSMELTHIALLQYYRANCAQHIKFSTYQESAILKGAPDLMKETKGLIAEFKEFISRGNVAYIVVDIFGKEYLVK